MSFRIAIPIFFSSLILASAQVSLGLSNEITDYDYNPTNTTVVDLDGDGDLDVIAHEEYFSRVFWFLNDGIGNFTHQGEWFAPIDESVDGWNNLAFLDYDEDGHLDLVGVLYESGPDAQTLCYTRGKVKEGLSQLFKDS